MDDAPPPPAPPHRRGLRVLVAEDEALIGLALELELAGRGHEVALAGDGREALELAARIGAFDALVTDMHMPRLRGDDLARLLRSERPGLPVVVVSANHAPGKADALLALGGPLSVLSKPVAFKLVADEVERLAAAAGGKA